MGERKQQKFWIVGLLMSVLLLSIILVGIWYYRVWSGQRSLQKEEEAKSYSCHCVFISETYDDPYYNSIYEGAKAAGEQQGIYVEDYGRQLSLRYGVDDLLEMAIAAQVDAIILKGSQDNSTAKLIDQATDQGIIVVTVGEDSVGSKRNSFIGGNRFRMGYDLCSQALRYADQEDEEIMVLLEHQKSTDNNITITGMQKCLDENSGSYILDAQTIDSSETYNVEEQIRMLLRNSSSRPDIIVCTSLMQTKSVYQSLVDLNCVGEIKVIGFYYTEGILEAIDKEVINSTYVMNATEVGEQAINSVSEWRQYGYVSDYVPVDARIIDQSNVKEELQSLRKKEETG